MAELTVSNTRLREGVWQGLLIAPEGTAAVPEIEVLHLGERLDGVRLAADTGVGNIWTLSVPVPAGLISEGVQTFLVREAGDGVTLARFSIAAGAVLEEDLRAELALVRAELDLLKRAFRRHCVETVDE